MSVDFGALVVVGALVSVFVQLVKNSYGSIKGVKTQAVVLVASLVVGGIYVLVRDTSYFQTVVQVLLSAGAVYAFVLSRFESSQAETEDHRDDV